TGDDRQDHPAPAQGCTPSPAALLTPQSAQLTVVSLHLAIKLTGIIRDLDIYSRQAVVVVSWFTALVHGRLLTAPTLQYEPGGPAASPWTTRLARAWFGTMEGCD